MNGRNFENRKNENRKNFGLRKSFFLPSAFKNLLKILHLK